MRRMLCILAVVTIAASSAPAQTFGAPDSFGAFAPVSRPWLEGIHAVSSHSQVTPGGKFLVAMDLQLKSGWFFYGPDPGPIVQSGSLNVDAPAFKPAAALWPADKEHASTQAGVNVVNFGYEGRVVVFQELLVPPDAKEGTYTIRIGPSGQACSSSSANCIALDLPSPAQASVKVRVGAASVSNPEWDSNYAQQLSAAADYKTLKARHGAARALEAVGVGTGYTDKLTAWSGLGLALLAGLILNVMPCVLPVIPLKVLSIVQSAGESRRRFVILGLAFAGGIMLFFLGLAVFSLCLQYLGQRAFNWGEHFQSVSFRIAMAMLLVAIAANLFGLFTVTVPSRVAAMASNGNILPHKRAGGVISAAGSGVLTAVLSTPCSFAILTLALAWAQTQKPWLGAVAIVTIGVGMAGPYALLTAFPRLVRWLPKPGRWMELFKQSMGFVLLIVAIWLIGSVSEYTYPLWVTAYGAVLVFCLWAWGAWVRYDSPLRQKLTIRGLAVVLAVMAGVWMLREPQPLAVRMETFSQDRIEQARRQGRTVLVDFTASWCLTCKTVEAWIYDDSDVAHELASRNVLAMKGDVSTSDLPANRVLTDELKEPGVPVTVIYPPIAPGRDPPAPIRLRGIFKRSDLLMALDEAAKAALAAPAADAQ